MSNEIHVGNEAKSDSRAMPLVSICIVTWNRRSDLERCIRSALDQTWPNVEIVVLDNDSPDGTAAFVRREFPEVRLVCSDKNLGCVSGRNLAFANCWGKYIYSLDDDGWLDPDAIGILASRLEADPELGVAMSIIKNVRDGQFAGTKPEGISDPVYLAEFVGCCFMVRREVFERLGGFSDDYFYAGEETDFAIRMLNAGLRTMIDPASVMYHAYSQVGRSSRRATYFSIRNGNKMALRSWPLRYCLLKILAAVRNALKYMILRGYLVLPIQLFWDLLVDMCRLPGRRKAVKAETIRDYFQVRRTRPSYRSPKSA